VSEVLAQSSPQAAADGVPVTHELGRWVGELRYDDIPGEVITHAKTCFLDAVGCGLFGSTQLWSQIAADVAVESSGGRGALLFGRSATASPADAALANGTAIHGYEIDDVHVSSSYHPASVSVPAALAVVGSRGGTGRDLLLALVAGYEVGIRTGICAGTTHSTSGFHVTGTVGPLGASATSAKALGLDTRRSTHAIAVGTTQASGLYSARIGAMAKRFHAGRAAQSGVIAALLAEKGFTGSPVAIEAPFGGFMSTLRGQHGAETILDGLGRRWETARVGFKIYAACASAHTTVDAVESLNARGVTAENLKTLTIWMTKKGYTNVGWRYVPGEVVSAQMNASYTAAVKLLDGDAFIQQYKPERLADPQVLAIVDRIEVRHDPELDEGGAAKRHAIRAEAELQDGRRVKVDVQDRLGSAERPVPPERIQQKFRTLVEGRRSAAAADELEALINELEGQDSLDRLLSLLA
jgi:aconitate decarboxylase